MLELAGEHTIDSFSKLIEGLELFPTPPERDVSVNYRRWAFESAALDLALRQAGTSLHQHLGREPRPVNFVVSMRLAPRPGERGAPSNRTGPGAARGLPGPRFKLDPTNDWTDELIAQLVETGAVDSLDLKGQYKGTPVDVETDPELYRKLIEAFPRPGWRTRTSTRRPSRSSTPVADRVTWDAPIHRVEDIEDQTWPPKMVNIKPSRFGPLSALFAAYDHCETERIGAYGGGQWELGPGRGHIQYLASVFHPDTPNEWRRRVTTPTRPNPGIHQPAARPGPPPTGFRWEPRDTPTVGSGPWPNKDFADGAQRADLERVRRLPAVHRRGGLLRLRDAPAPRRLLLPPGGRGAEPRDDHDPVPAGPGEEVRIPDIKSQQTKYDDLVGPVKMALEQEKRVTEEINALFKLARESRRFPGRAVPGLVRQGAGRGGRLDERPAERGRALQRRTRCWPRSSWPARRSATRGTTPPPRPPQEARSSPGARSAARPGDGRDRSVCRSSMISS